MITGGEDAFAARSSAEFSVSPAKRWVAITLPKVELISGERRMKQGTLDSSVVPTSWNSIRMTCLSIQGTLAQCHYELSEESKARRG